MENKNEVVHMKCKRGSDRITNGQNCLSLSAERLSPVGSMAASFKCVKCGFIWSVSLGGTFNSPV